MEIDKKLYTEIKEYCNLNGLKVRQYIESILKKAFMEDKYGERPPMFKVTSQPSPTADLKESSKTVGVYKEESNGIIEQVIESKQIKSEEKQDAEIATSKTKKRILS